MPERSQLPSQLAPSSNKALLWGATGEQEWTPALTTGMRLSNPAFLFVKKETNVLSTRFLWS